MPLKILQSSMSKCEQCIMREFSTLKSLSKEELKNISSHKDTFQFKKGEVLFSEGNVLNGVYCIKEGVCKLTRLLLKSIQLQIQQL